MTPDREDGASRQRIGRVIAGSGAQHLVLLEREADDQRPLCAGDILVVGVGRHDPLTGSPAPLCIAAVTAMTVPAPQVDGGADEIRIAEVDLYGTLTGEGFTRGTDRTPALGDAVCLASSDDLRALYAHGAKVATLTARPGQDASVDTSALIGGFGILGCAASGKSASLAVLVRALLRARAGARPVLIDTHDEYARSFGRAATVIRPGPGFVPHWMLSFDELCWALSLCGGSLGAAERALLAEAVPAARIRMMQRQGEASGSAVSLDTPLPYRVTDAISFLDRSMHADRARPHEVFKRLRERLSAAVGDPRLSVVFGAVAATDTLPQLLGDVFGLREGAPPMTVVQTGALDLGLDRLVASVLCRLAKVLGEGTDARQRVLVLIEDAERFAPQEQPGSEGVGGAEALCRAAVLDLTYSADTSGTSVGLVSARPSLVDERLLRALPTLFIHRLPSEGERDRVAMVLPEGSGATVAGVGTQRPRDCTVVGSGVPAPGRYTMTSLPEAAVPRRVGRAAPNLARADIAAALIQRWRFGEAGAAPRPHASTVRPAPPSTLRSVPAA